MLWLLPAVPGWAANELDECRAHFQAGRYAACVVQADAAIGRGFYDEEYRLLKLRALREQGAYPQIEPTLAAALGQYPSSIQLRLWGAEHARWKGDREGFQRFLDEIDFLVQRSPWRYSDADNLVVLGRAALLMGADARQVLEGFYDRARKQSPKLRAAYLAAAELALDKADDALAAEHLQGALKLEADEPEAHFLLARAFLEGEPARAGEHLETCLSINPNYIPALLLQADRLILAEEYQEALAKLDAVWRVNPREPKAWAYRAVLAHLLGDPRGEVAFRDQALAHCPRNPDVDFVIGQKLSQRYRFREGAERQRQALAFDPEYVPARMQLAQDLLRLGQEDEGWQLASDVYHADGYHVAAHNLVALRDKLLQYRTLQDADFIVRMEAREADVYGPRVLRLLHAAKTELCAKYGLELKHPVVVEIFPQPSDFAVRTFGMPGAAGFLGVCFGKVITANSPASQAEHPANWESVLWHEFCHVVTLELTANRLPRWLSEGISVYEEGKRHPAWGAVLHPYERDRILNGGLTPLGQLSSAFLAPPTPRDLQFAYFESAWAVEYLVESYGLPALRAVLRDLRAGLPINDALARHTTDLPALERGFEEFARARAAAWNPDTDWRPLPEPLAADATPAQLAAFLVESPQHWHGWRALAQQYTDAKDWPAAERAWRRAYELYPQETGTDSAAAALAVIYKEQGRSAEERQILAAWVRVDSAALVAYDRLMELAGAAGDWAACRAAAEWHLAVNPLVVLPHRRLAEACAAVGEVPTAVEAYASCLVLGAPDAAEVHYRMAQLLLKDPGNRQAAERHVLEALEAAPRFRAAQKLLLELERAAHPPTISAPPVPAGGVK